MKILQICNYDYDGGGCCIVMERLHHGLMKNGIDSKILCGIKNLNSPYTVQIPRPKIFEKIIEKITWRMGLNDIHCLSSFGIKKMSVYLNADVLHIHSMDGNYFSYLALPTLTRDKPTVFTLHNMWALTGHCSHSYDCDKWKTGCGKCPYPNRYPVIKRDATKIEWKLKQWIYKHSNLFLITISEWSKALVKQSILKRFPTYHIPNGVDIGVYQPLDSEQCRSILGIPTDKKVIMFMARTLDPSSLHGFTKGGDLLIKALNALPKSLKSEIILLLVGKKGEAIAEVSGIKTLNLGYIGNDRLKAVCYSAADLFVHPARVETFGLTIIESMACGTPIIAFRTCAIPELVRPGVTGYVAQPENPEDLSRGIVQLLEDNDLRYNMRLKCREIASKEYTLDLNIIRHINLYRQILQISR